MNKYVNKIIRTLFCNLNKLIGVLIKACIWQPCKPLTAAQITPLNPEPTYHINKHRHRLNINEYQPYVTTFKVAIKAKLKLLQNSSKFNFTFIANKFKPYVIVIVMKLVILK